MARHSFDKYFHKSLFFTISGLFAVFVAITLSLQYYQEKNIRTNTLYTLLQEYNHYVAGTLPQHLTDSDTLIPLFDNYPYRLTIIDAKEGRVLSDNSTHDTIESPHLDRPEIQAAINGEKKAYSIRYSETMQKDYFYVAYKHNDYIIRSSMPYNDTVSNLLHVDPLFRYILISIAILFVGALLIYCNLLGKAISELDEFARIAQQNRPLKQLEVPESNIFGHITNNLRTTYEALRQAREALALEEEKLLAHIQTSREGIAIFTHENKMIVSNNLFIQYINHITDRTIDPELKEIFNEPALNEITHHVTQTYNRKGHEDNSIIKQIRIVKNGSTFIVRGILFHDNSFEISIFDNTDREREDLLKKQLTQNIAHELKTPISSIRGYLETIITTPDIDKNKEKLFLERCYAQTRRLSDLLNDISMLNRLDETSDIFDRQELNISTIISDAINDSVSRLEEKSMSITTLGITDTMPIIGNNSLLYSIFRNLIDNSIAYAGVNTNITINCYLIDEKYYYISVTDNGMGVDESHLNRLFERFYRVDKGRSRKLGGTGLGLAIVKNAVLFHGGDVMAKNAAEGGLEILFSLRKE